MDERDEDRIALVDIKNVSYSVMMNPPRVTLSLRKPSIFSSAVAFLAPARMFSVTMSNPRIDDRIDAARRAKRA